MKILRSIDICPPADNSRAEQERYNNEKLAYAAMREEEMLNAPSLILDTLCSIIARFHNARQK